jgi:hypothetical protein
LIFDRGDVVVQQIEDFFSVSGGGRTQVTQLLR